MKASVEAQERCLEQALREQLGGEEVFDVAAVVRQRAAEGQWPAEDARREGPRWLVAAGIAAGLAVAVGTALLARSRATPETVPAALPQDPGKPAPGLLAPEWTVVTEAAAIGSLDSACRALRLRAWPESPEAGAKAGVAAALDRTPRLERLDLDASDRPGPQLTEADFKRIGEQISLRELRLGFRTEIEPGWLAPLAALPNLTRLALPLVAIGDEGARALARLPSLQALELAFDGTITDAGVASLATVPGLRELSLRGCGRLTSSGLRALAACVRLEHLDLRYCCGIGGGASEDLPPAARSRIEQMLSAELVLASKPGGGADDEVLRALAALPALRELLLTGCPSITAAGLEALSSRPLRRLAVSIRSGDCSAVTAALPPTLENLSLAWSSAFDEAAADPLGKRVPQLQKLDLFQCTSLGDAALGKVLAGTALRELELRGCRLLTAACVPMLLAASHLEELDVSGQEWLDDAVEAKLKAMPKMRDLRCKRRGGGMLAK